MRNGSYEQQTVNQVADRLPEAGRVLRKYGIDPASRLSLAQAAAVTSSPTDAVLAILEYKARRALRRQAPPTDPGVAAQPRTALEEEAFEEEAVGV